MRAEGRDRTIALEASLFADVEKITRPIVDSVVRLFTRQLDISDEDVRQEARIALLKALRKYDYNASSGGMLMFFRRSIRRRLLQSLAYDRRQIRHPYVHIERNGKRVSKPVPFVAHEEIRQRRHDGQWMRSLDPRTESADVMDTFPADVNDPETILIMREEQDAADRIARVLERTLDARAVDILRCKMNPPRTLQLLMAEDFADEPSLNMICRHLGITKGIADGAVRRLREHATPQVLARLAE